MKMKRFNLIPLALTTLMLGACSSEDGLNLGGGNSVAQGEKGYISFSLNLPTVKSTANRANDDFDDGAATEYNVEDATLLLFSGANESDATFAGAYDLSTKMTGGTSDGDNITTTYKIAQEVTKPVGANVYAMVVINGKTSNVLTESGGTWSIKGQTLTASTTKYKDLAGAAYNLSNTDVANIASTTGDGCFLMTNAPLYTQAGGVSNPTGGSVQTLTEINPNNIFTTEEEAKANPAANVYVERAVAKVTVTGNTTGTQDDGNIANYEIKGWTLDVTNQSSYQVRNVKDADWWGLTADGKDYRFVGAAAVADGLYRTYWGIDPNYSTEGTFTTLAGTTPTSLKAVGENDYCLENTFDLARMNQDQTTRVIVAAALDFNKDGKGDDFYVLDNDKSNTALTFEGITNTIKAAYLANGTVVGLLEANLNGGESIGADDLDVTFNEKATTGGYVTVSEITIKDESASKFTNGIPEGLQAANNDAIIADVNAAHKIAFYKGGVAYYPVMIKHFGDDLTPWSNGEVYGSNKADFLGRYGVLRNNWYSINVTGIKSIGDPEVPEIYGTPDDPSESWISVSINILSWAKRSQSVDL